MASFEGLAVEGGEEEVGWNVGEAEGGGEVVEGFLVAFVGELPGAEVAGEGEAGREGAEAVDGFVGAHVVIFDPVRAVGTDGDEREIRGAEASADVREAGGGCGVADVVEGRPAGGGEVESAPEGASGGGGTLVAVAPVVGRGEGVGDTVIGMRLPPIQLDAANRAAVVAQQALQAERNDVEWVIPLRETAQGVGIEMVVVVV